MAGALISIFEQIAKQQKPILKNGLLNFLFYQSTVIERSNIIHLFPITLANKIYKTDTIINDNLDVPASVGVDKLGYGIGLSVVKACSYGNLFSSIF